MNIKFISYTGKYPNLCSGVLTIEINGKEYKFGHDIGDYDYEKCYYKNDNFERFWSSGGRVEIDEDLNMWAKENEWELNREWDKVDDKHPQWIIDILPKLLKLFNENVSYGCCGGCI